MGTGKVSGSVRTVTASEAAWPDRLRRRRLVPGLLAAGLVLAACGGGESSSPSESWSPADLAVADLDGDGRADVIAIGVRSSGDDGQTRSGYLSVYLQTAPGVFAEPRTYAAGTQPTRMAVGDVDGDGAPDVLVVDVEGQTTSLFRQDPANRGVLLDGQTLIGNVRGGDVVLADLNRDGVPDVAVGDSRSLPGRIVIRYQDASARGTFLPAVDASMSGAPIAMAAADVDGDGAVDLLAWVVTNPGQTGVPPDAMLVLRFQEPGGSLGPERMLATRSALQARRVWIADVDGDGAADLFAALAPAVAGARGALVSVLQAAPRVFAPAVDTTLEGLASVDDAAVGDLARDVRLDSAVLRSTSVSTSGASTGQMVGIYANAGDGRFSFLSSTALPTSVGRVAAGDLDGDGLTDLLFLGDENRVTVMYRSGTQAGGFEAPVSLR